ncbi:MAG: response regulator [Magnetococcus sp. THC-1_WYH]
MIINHLNKQALMNYASNKIIIIDDKEDILAAVCRQFKFEGFDVYTATNTPDAERLISCVRPDLVILDYHMPNESGLDFLARLRSEGNDIPVIMLTADTSKEVVIMAMRYGANDFHQKPFDFDFLLISVKREIQRRETEIRLRRSLAMQEIMCERARQLEEFSHQIRTATHHVLSFTEIASNLVGGDLHANIGPPLEQIRKAALTIQELIGATEEAAESGNHDEYTQTRQVE